MLVLCLLGVVGAAAAMVGPMWAKAAQRDREAQLLRTGRLYAHALTRFRQVSPGNVKQFPKKLTELTLDNRFVGTVRHLRRLYEDPIEPDTPWGLVLNDEGRITGVYSTSELKPLSDRGPGPDGTLIAASRYTDWRFMATQE